MENQISPGFVTALGTPLDECGCVVEESFRLEIEKQIISGASGVFALGSMGMQCAVPDNSCVKAAQIAAETVAGRVPCLFGVMDNSVERVIQRIESVAALPLAGVVVTTPFYFVSEEDTLVTFFKNICARSPFSVYLYDLPGVTKMKITANVCDALADIPNLCGIKTPDLELIKHIHTNGPSRWTTLYSNIDRFAEAYQEGAVHELDGMFSCTPRSACAAYEYFAKGEFDKASGKLADIISLRDLMAKYRIFPSFTAIMNLLGYAGNFHPDYFAPVSAEAKAELRSKLIEIGELDE